MTADTPDDASIPVLTERLTLPPLELDTTLPLESQAPSTSAPTVPLALDTSLPLGLPQAPPPRAAPAPARPTPAAAPPMSAPAARAPVPPPVVARAPVPPSAAAPPVAAAPPAASTEGAATHWTRIELALRSAILQSIADALPQQIDSIVRNRMNEAIERLITQLVAETRLAVAASLHDIVDQAVRAELARLRRQQR